MNVSLYLVAYSVFYYNFTHIQLLNSNIIDLIFNKIDDWTYSIHLNYFMVIYIILYMSGICIKKVLLVNNNMCITNALVLLKLKFRPLGVWFSQDEYEICDTSKCS